MKFLHIADLHLGRLFHERPLVEDQQFILDQIIAILGTDGYGALVVAGDVYDRSIPSPEAVSLWGNFLSVLRSRFPELQILLVPGNHDSAERLAYASDLFSAMGIHIGFDPGLCAEPVIVPWKEERIAFFLLPFLVPGSDLGIAKDDDGIGVPNSPPRTQRDLAIQAAEKLERGRFEALRSGATGTVLVAHLFASGGRESESERVFLGTAERVDPQLFARFDYVALGHLHRFQRASENAWYSGSPLAYSFDETEAEKVCVSVDLGTRPISVVPIPLRPLHPVRKLTGTFHKFLQEILADPQDYLELSLTDQTVIQNPLALLRPRYPNLLSIKQPEAMNSRASSQGERVVLEGMRGRRGAVEDFQDFLADLYGGAEQTEVDLFRQMAAEAEHAAP